MKRSLILLVVASLFLLAACSAGDDPSRPPVAASGGSGMDGMDGYGYGRAGDPASVDRAIDVQLLDSLAFSPSTLRAEPGETIRFRVTNAGTIDHEFVLGDDATQEEHEAAMGAGGTMQMEGANLLALGPGETGSLVWRFTEPGNVRYGCHVPDHYAAGMVGTITVI